MSKKENNMKIYTKALRILLIVSIAFASTYTQAHDYSFLKLLKVGQCAWVSGNSNSQNGSPLIAISITPCVNKLGLTPNKITHIGIDYIIFENNSLFPAQSISKIHLGD